MKRGFLCGIAILLATIFVSGTISVSANNQNGTVGEVKCLSDGIAAFKSGGVGTQEWINTSLSENAGITSEWYIIALSQSGEYDFSSYRDALNEYVAGKNIAAATTRQKYALSLIASGQKDGYVTEVAKNSIGQQGVMSYVYGLILLNNGIECAETTDDVKSTLLSLQNGDGGWAVTGTNSDNDVTAMAVQALAPYYNTDADIKSAIDRAIILLSSRQLENGDYISYGKANPESTAQVWLALTELGIDGLADERFIKNGKTLLDGIMQYRLDDGSFRHLIDGKYNENATAQVYYCSIAYLRMKNGGGRFFDLDTKNEAAIPDSNSSEPSSVESVSDKSDETVSVPKRTEKSGYKLWVTVAIVGIAAVVCILLFARGKRNIKNFVFVTAIAALLIAFILLTNFQSAEEYYNESDISKENAVGSVTIEIRCDTVAGKSDASYISTDGTVLKASRFEFEEGDTVYDVLIDAVRKNSIQLETTGGDGMRYVTGINHLYELQFGDLSGWIYLVNGESVSVGCDEYELHDGDVIVWHYTCELGNDIK